MHCCNNSEMFFCMRSILSCSQNDQGFQTVFVGLTIDSDRAKFLAVTQGLPVGVILRHFLECPESERIHPLPRLIDGIQFPIRDF